MVQNPEFKIKMNLGNLTVKVKIICLVIICKDNKSLQNYI